MTVIAAVFSAAGVLLRATADALGAFAYSIEAQMEIVPDYIPEWIDDGSAG